MAAEGYSNADIAKTLLVTEQTVSSAMVEHLPQARREKPDGRWARLQAVDKRQASHDCVTGCSPRWASTETYSTE